MTAATLSDPIFHDADKARAHFEKLRWPDGRTYVTEFGFRHNTRVTLDINDGERTDLALTGTVGKRLTYRQTDEAYV